MFKNAYDAFFYDEATATVTQITDIDYPGYHTYSVTLTSSSTTATATMPALAVTSITSTGGVATMTTAAAHGLTTGDSVLVAGAAQTEYNGSVTVTVTGASTFTYDIVGTPTSPATGTITYQKNHGLSVGDSVTIAGATQTEYNGAYTVVTVADSQHFTYTFAGSATTPATGTITAVGGRTTVPGIVFLDGYFFVMDSKATIRNCVLTEPLQWSGLDFITAQIEPGAGVALAKSQSYVIAFKEWSTEFFYDAANSVGSPLSPVSNGFTLTGCASGDSVANMDGMLFWVSQTRQKGRAVHMMQGLNDAQISTPDVERILNLSTLATVHSYGVKIAGHAFYLLTLVDLNKTLVFDMASKTWALWSSLTLGDDVSVTSIALSGTTATVTTAAAHNLLDGDPVLIAGADQAAYNGIQTITYVDATHYTFQTTAGTTTPATGTITSTPYTETYFKYTKYINALGRDLVQHESDGTLCELTESVFRDVDSPINVKVRTGKFDGGNSNLKRFAAVEIIGNKVSANAYIRHSGDDYVTNTQYRPVDLSANRSIIRRLGSDRRRSFEVKHTDNTSLQLAFIDIDAV
jgi:hypothetical protein